MMTFPQVIIGGELVGGFTEVQAAAESGRLDELLIRGQPAA
jgi:glutaredoxin-related protein